MEVPRLWNCMDVPRLCKCTKMCHDLAIVWVYQDLATVPRLGDKMEVKERRIRNHFRKSFFGSSVNNKNVSMARDESNKSAWTTWWRESCTTTTMTTATTTITITATTMITTTMKTTTITTTTTNTTTTATTATEMTTTTTTSKQLRNNYPACSTVTTMIGIKPTYFMTSSDAQSQSTAGFERIKPVLQVQSTLMWWV